MAPHYDNLKAEHVCFEFEHDGATKGDLRQMIIEECESFRAAKRDRRRARKVGKGDARASEQVKDKQEEEDQVVEEEQKAIYRPPSAARTRPASAARKRPESAARSRPTSAARARPISGWRRPESAHRSRAEKAVTLEDKENGERVAYKPIERKPANGKRIRATALRKEDVLADTTNEDNISGESWACATNRKCACAYLHRLTCSHFRDVLACRR